jgi:hypothetical protein
MGKIVTPFAPLEKNFGETERDFIKIFKLILTRLSERV